MRFVRATILAVAALVLLAACARQQAQPPAPAPSAAGEIAITENEWSIQPKEIRAKPGKVTFVIKNQGAVEHNFVIEGVGEVDKIAPGETKKLEVTLQPGTYKVVCNLPGHQEAGMEATLTVSE
ncbi:MAG: cupredoxin domain-containing protein [Armatimonadota bacterium]|nr:cupredoxin domain-containing protein [Armatimonadota bacterium]